MGLFMKKLILSLLVFYPLFSFSQVESIIRNSHCFGGGVQWLNAKENMYYHDIGKISYLEPGYTGFYKFCKKNIAEKMSYVFPFLLTIGRVMAIIQQGAWAEEAIIPVSLN